MTTPITDKDGQVPLARVPEFLLLAWARHVAPASAICFRCGKPAIITEDSYLPDLGDLPLRLGREKGSDLIEQCLLIAQAGKDTLQPTDTNQMCGDCYFRACATLLSREKLSLMRMMIVSWLLTAPANTSMVVAQHVPTNTNFMLKAPEQDWPSLLAWLHLNYPRQ